MQKRRLHLSATDPSRTTGQDMDRLAFAALRSRRPSQQDVELTISIIAIFIVISVPFVLTPLYALFALYICQRSHTGAAALGLMSLGEHVTECILQTSTCKPI